MQLTLAGSRIKFVEKVGVSRLQKALLAGRALGKNGKDAGEHSLLQRARCRARCLNES